MDRNSKTGRGNNVKKEISSATTKKMANEAVKEMKEGDEGLLVVVEEAAVAEVEELWLHSWSGVDEGMPWATRCYPFWEAEAALCGDDQLWDYDIWGLKGGDNIAANL